MSLLDDILNPNVVDGVVTSMSERENITCLQKIMRIDKLIREYNEKYEALTIKYSEISPNIEEITRIANEAEAILNRSIENNIQAQNAINAFSNRYPTSYYNYIVPNGLTSYFDITTEYAEIYGQCYGGSRFDVFVNNGASNIDYIEIDNMGNSILSIKITKLQGSDGYPSQLLVEIDRSSTAQNVNNRIVRSYTDTNEINISISANYDTHLIWSSIERIS